MKNVLVVMSTYNGEKYIVEQIESILNQKNCSVKLFVRDDGSKDATIEILKKYRKQGLLDYEVGENKKPAKSFLNALKDTGDADYYAFADQDDIWDLDKLSSAIKMLEEKENQNIPLLYCSNLRVVDENQNILKEKLLPKKIVKDYKQLIIRSPHIFGCTEVFNKSLCEIIKQREVPENFIMHDLWIAIIASSYGEIMYDNEAHLNYRQHGGNHTGATQNVAKKWKNRFNVFFQKYPWSIADQAKEIISYMGTDFLEEKKLLNYTQIVACYKKNIFSKIKYLKMIKHDAMNYKQYIFHASMILMGKL